MPGDYNVYCDESCHLENDGQRAMVLGAVWCPTRRVREISRRIRDIKTRNKVPSSFEIKWTKVSASKVQLYLDLIDYFFDDDDLHLRVLVIPEKNRINHGMFPRQSHDDWYYKMYFTMLKTILEPESSYYIYLDIKDTRSGEKSVKLHDVLCNNMYDFSRDIVRRVQLVHSHEIEQVQLVDLLIGAISYLNRGLNESPGKLAIIKRIQDRSGYSLDKSTLLRENKVNIFRWQANWNE